MSAPFQLRILAADHPFYEGPCESLIVPTTDGKYGILAHHANFIGAVVPGTIHYQIPGEEFKLVSVASGICKVEDNVVTILVISAERPEEIDVARARHDAEEAKRQLTQKGNIREYRVAQAALARAMGRLETKRTFDDINGTSHTE